MRMFEKAGFWILGCSVGTMAIYCAARLVRYRRNDEWPTVDGHVEGYGKIRHMDDNGSASLSFTSVSFSYSVGGEWYSGEWLTPTLQNDTALEKFLAKEMPVGKAVSIRYMPKHPERSLLADAPEIERSDAIIQLGL
jgi:hypothetical protein